MNRKKLKITGYQIMIIIYIYQVLHTMYQVVHSNALTLGGTVKPNALATACKSSSCTSYMFFRE